MSGPRVAPFWAGQRNHGRSVDQQVDRCVDRDSPQEVLGDFTVQPVVAVRNHRRDRSRVLLSGPSVDISDDARLGVDHAVAVLEVEQDVLDERSATVVIAVVVQSRPLAHEAHRLPAVRHLTMHDVVVVTVEDALSLEAAIAQKLPQVVDVVHELVGQKAAVVLPGGHRPGVVGVEADPLQRTEPFLQLRQVGLNPAVGQIRDAAAPLMAACNQQALSLGDSEGLLYLSEATRVDGQRLLAQYRNSGIDDQLQLSWVVTIGGTDQDAAWLAGNQRFRRVVRLGLVPQYLRSSLPAFATGVVDAHDARALHEWQMSVLDVSTASHDAHRTRRHGCSFRSGWSCLVYIAMNYRL